jgi:hypothetical protein
MKQRMWFTPPCVVLVATAASASPLLPTSYDLNNGHGQASRRPSPAGSAT